VGRILHLVEVPSRAETWGSSGNVPALDDPQVSAPFDAGAKAEVASSKTRVLTAQFGVIKLWFWWAASRQTQTTDTTINQQKKGNDERMK
jgi:hypothetical protein